MTPTLEVQPNQLIPPFLEPQPPQRAAPTRIQDLGIPVSLVQDLILRRMLADGFSTLSRLSHMLKLSIPIVESVFRQFRAQKLVEVTGAVGDDYSITLTGSGRAIAGERAQVCQYSGPAPVSLSAYCAAVREQVASVEVDRDTLRTAFSDLVVPDVLLDQLGPAVISQSSVFLYGPPGSGKTSVAERMLRVYRDHVFIPYAVEVDSQIITLYDPVVHEAVLSEEEADFDARWLACRRPCVTVGGELVSSMLELHRDAGSGVYAAPLQMKANNGILIIDDFGRQVMSPRDLLNRWIVPLDRRVDYLALSYGVKFQIPFETMVVFSSNLDPTELGDGAFLRRIQNKIYVKAVEAELFDEIFARVTRKRSIACEPGLAPYFRELCAMRNMELSASYPNAICRIFDSLKKYERQPLHMSRADLLRAVDLFFARTTKVV